MNDVRDESWTHPKPFPLTEYRQLLVLATHPDDKAYGCDGLINEFALMRTELGEENLHLLIVSQRLGHGIRGNSLRITTA